MGGPTVTLRCPACGADLRVVLAPSPPTQWFPCPSCHRPVPVVVPRAAPPLYSWEVMPQLYPALPRPKIRRWNLKRATGAALSVVAVLALAFAGLLGAYAVAAPGGGGYTVSGTVLAESAGGTVPATGAAVSITEEGGQTVAGVVGPDGDFQFTGVPTGGVTLNVTLAGYAPASVSTFVSPVYDAGSTGIGITLARGGAGNGTSAALSPFPDLTSFLASIVAGIALLALVGIVAALAAAVTLRQDRPAVGVVGGSAGIFAPLVLALLALNVPFPIVELGPAVAGGFGAFVVAVGALRLAQRNRPPDLG